MFSCVDRGRDAELTQTRGSLPTARMSVMSFPGIAIRKGKLLRPGALRRDQASRIHDLVTVNVTAALVPWIVVTDSA